MDIGFTSGASGFHLTTDGSVYVGPNGASVLASGGAVYEDVTLSTTDDGRPQRLSLQLGAFASTQALVPAAPTEQQSRDSFGLQGGVSLADSHMAWLLDAKLGVTQQGNEQVSMWGGAAQVDAQHMTALTPGRSTDAHAGFRFDGQLLSGSGVSLAGWHQTSLSLGVGVTPSELLKMKADFLGGIRTLGNDYLGAQTDLFYGVQVTASSEPWTGVRFFVSGGYSSASNQHAPSFGPLTTNVIASTGGLSVLVGMEAGHVSTQAPTRP